MLNFYITDEANRDFNGESNTQAIVDQLQSYNGGNYAAKKCADLVAFGFDDWYLPAAAELNMMYQQLGPTTNGYGGSGDMPENWYWSSSENNGDYAWLQIFAGGLQGDTSKSDDRFGCRCVRR